MDIRYPANVAVGICVERGMTLVGIDFLDEAGTVFAHTHFMPSTADQLWKMIGEAIVEARAAAPAAPATEKRQ